MAEGIAQHFDIRHSNDRTHTDGNGLQLFHYVLWAYDGGKNGSEYAKGYICSLPKIILFFFY